MNGRMLLELMSGYFVGIHLEEQKKGTRNPDGGKMKFLFLI
jgi:hypothetical protein